MRRRHDCAKRVMRLGLGEVTQESSQQERRATGYGVGILCSGQPLPDADWLIAASPALAPALGEAVEFCIVTKEPGSVVQERLTQSLMVP